MFLVIAPSGKAVVGADEELVLTQVADAAHGVVAGEVSTHLASLRSEINQLMPQAGMTIFGRSSQ